MTSSRLDRVRARMATLGVDLLVVRSTDPYLNEYVPPPLALRPWLTGFTGSMGEALVAPDRAWLFVDGRYWLQAESEVDPEAFQVVRVTLSSGLDRALFEEVERQAARPSGPLRVGFEADRVTLAERRDWESRLPGVQWVPLNPSPVAEARREADGREDLSRLDGPIRWIPPEMTGHGVLERLQSVFSALPDSVDRVWVQRLDEVAWLTGLRGQGLPHQATFRGAALAARDRIWLGLDGSPSLPEAMNPHVEVVPRAELPSLCAPEQRVAFDPGATTVAAFEAFQGRMRPHIGASGLASAKARKTPAELATMRQALAAADRVMAQLVEEVCRRVVDGESVSEKDVADRVESLFLEAGAVGLSFRVIAAAGTHGALIHYGRPDPERFLERGELMLVDCGAHFEAGYATDLTRTFFVGAPDESGSPRQRFVYTTVLRAAMAGMRAVLGPGATGAQLDGIVREPLWREGLDYSHGTGHGVGINVHEFPPRISGRTPTPLEAGQVFSIEPGHYDPDFGGVRIENLCTLVELPDRPGFLRVQPLTFAPLDDRLIDTERLRPDEREWLSHYRNGHA